MNENDLSYQTPDLHTCPETFRRRLRQGLPVLGTFAVEFAGAAVVDVLRGAGFDFVMVDCEHGSYSLRDIEAMARAALHNGICLLVRVPSIDRGMITRVLDIGAQGIVVPSLKTMAQVLPVVEYSKYHPVGSRGAHFYRGNTLNQPLVNSWRQFMDRANDSLLTIIQIETKEAIDIIDQIAATPGVDGLYVGPGDLSISCDVECNVNNELISNVIHQVSLACRKHNKISGCHVPNIEKARAVREKHNIQMLGFDCDLGFFNSAAKVLAGDFHKQLVAPVII